MSKKIKFSIVVAVYNRPDEMSELLESILNQKYRDFEIIVIDDGSENSSRDIATFYKNKLLIKYFFGLILFEILRILNILCLESLS